MVVIDNLSKYGFTLLLKNKNAQTITNSFENILLGSKRKPNLIESVRGRHFYNEKFQIFLNINNFEHYSRNNSVVAVIAKVFYRIIRDLLKTPVFEKGDSNWIDFLPTKTKQYRIPSSTELSPIQASLKKNEGIVYKNLLD